MDNEEKKKAKMLEEKIGCIQADIDRLCEISKIAEEKNAKITLSYLVGVNGEGDKCYVYRGNVLIGTATNLTQLTCAIFGSSSSEETMDGWLGKLLLDDFEKIKWVG